MSSHPWRQKIVRDQPSKIGLTQPYTCLEPLTKVTDNLFGNTLPMKQNCRNRCINDCTIHHKYQNNHDNQLTPRPGQSEAMLLCRGNSMGPDCPGVFGRLQYKMGDKSTRVRFDSRSQINMRCTCNGFLFIYLNIFAIVCPKST